MLGAGKRTLHPASSILTEMLSVEEALDLVQEHCDPLVPRRLPLAELAGLVLAEDIASDIDSPPYDKAMMDGYAVRSADRQPERRILEEIAAGAVPRHTLTPGTASRIMTGAPLPDGADAVVPVEQSELIGECTVRLRQIDCNRGQHVLPLGASMRAGDLVVRRGVVVRPVEIGILAETGHDAALVIPRPRLAILPTGNELVPVSQRPGGGQIRNSNGPMLVAAGARAGAIASEIPTRAIRAKTLRAALKKDFLATYSSSAAAFPPVNSISCRKCLPSSAWNKCFTKSPFVPASHYGSASKIGAIAECSSSDCRGIRSAVSFVSSYSFVRLLPRSPVVGSCSIPPLKRH